MRAESVGGNARTAAGAKQGPSRPDFPPWVRLEALCVPLTIPRHFSMIREFHLADFSRW